MVPLCARRNDRQRLARYTAECERLATVLNAAGWDGKWYRRAYYDGGEPLGSIDSDECQIDALAQAWAVLSGVASRERADLAIAAVEDRLVDEAAGLIRLLDPPFDRTAHDPGYIKGYVPGVRENGGQYTHGVLWTIQALTSLREGDRAGALLELLNPVYHASTPEGVQRYRVEPYVVAADVYGGSEHPGRGGWTWYTGSAGWMYRIALERVLGLRRSGKTLSLQPCIPSQWGQFELSYRYLSSSYRIRVENPERVSYGVLRLELDGKAVRESYVRLVDDGKTHEVRVTLGSSEAAPQSQRDPHFRAG
jgi:cellobiose phosphorylase